MVLLAVEGRLHVFPLDASQPDVAFESLLYWHVGRPCVEVRENIENETVDMLISRKITRGRVKSSYLAK